jgi:hypothetical protein
MIPNILLIGLALFLPAMVAAQSDPYGKIDTIYAELDKIDSNIWTISVNYTNDEAVVGLSIPLKYNSGLVKIIADSAVYVGGRAAHFTYRGFRVDTAIQCLTLGMLANIGPTTNRLEPGSGRLVTIYLSSIDDLAINKLVVDTTTTNPNNSLLVMTDAVIGTPPDTVRPEFNKRQVVPAFVSRRAKK